MKLKRLVTFGDSWPAGAELSNVRDAFPVQIAKILNIEYFNAAVPATGIDQACYYFLQDLNNYKPDTYNWFDKSNRFDDIILFCLSGSTRSWHFKDGTDKETTPLNKTIESKMYYSYLYTDKLAEINLIKNVIIVQQLCKSNNIPCYIVTNWEKLPDNQHIDQKFVYNKTLLGILGLGHLDPDDNHELDLSGDFKTSPYIYPNISHPNILGHKIIAEELANWIKSFD